MAKEPTDASVNLVSDEMFFKKNCEIFVDFKKIFGIFRNF